MYKSTSACETLIQFHPLKLCHSSGSVRYVTWFLYLLPILEEIKKSNKFPCLINILRDPRLFPTLWFFMSIRIIRYFTMFHTCWTLRWTLTSEHVDKIVHIRFLFQFLRFLFSFFIFSLLLSTFKTHLTERKPCRIGNWNWMENYGFVDMLEFIFFGVYIKFSFSSYPSSSFSSSSYFCL